MLIVSQCKIYIGNETAMNEKLSEPNGPDNATNIANSANGENTTKRDTERDSLFVKANLKFHDGGEEGQVIVRNLSEGGLMAEASIQAARGSCLEIELKNIGWISGKVAWVAERKLGIAFDHPIDPTIVRKPSTEKSDLPYYLQKLNRHGEKIKIVKY